MPPSFHFDVGGAYDGGPLRELVREQLAEFGGRADLDLGAEGRESRARLRLGKAIAERSIELVDDGGGVPAGATTPSQNGACSLG